MSDRLGVSWGLAGGVAIASVAETREIASWAVSAGFDSLWISQSTAVDPIVALAAAAHEAEGLREVGTSVVPLYGRHPIGLAQMTRTAQSALGGRLTLGIGPSHAEPVNDALGMSWDRPLGYTREFLDGLLPLLAGEPAHAEGDQLTARTELAVDAPDTPVLIAALGPKMLALAGARAAGTTLGQCGPKTIADYISPTINEAAAAAGRATPRIMALVRICVTDDHDAAFAQARDVAAWYARLPSYAAVIEREGLSEPAELHLIGSWEQILDGLGAYASAGVTDLRVEVTAPSAADRDATRAALASYLG